MAVIAGPYVGGLQAKLYYNTGTRASPVWVLITRAIDVSVDISQTAVEVPSRASTWMAHLPGLKNATITFGYRVPGGTDTVFDFLLTCLTTPVMKEFAVMDQAIATTGAQGFVMYAQLEAMNLSQGMEEGAVMEFTLRPAYVEESSARVDPLWLEI